MPPRPGETSPPPRLHRTSRCCGLQPLGPSRSAGRPRGRCTAGARASPPAKGERALDSQLPGAWPRVATPPSLARAPQLRCLGSHHRTAQTPEHTRPMVTFRTPGARRRGRPPRRTALRPGDGAEVRRPRWGRANTSSGEARPSGADRTPAPRPADHHAAWRHAPAGRSPASSRGTPTPRIPVRPPALGTHAQNPPPHPPQTYAAVPGAAADLHVPPHRPRLTPRGALATSLGAPPETSLAEVRPTGSRAHHPFRQGAIFAEGRQPEVTLAAASLAECHLC